MTDQEIYDYFIQHPIEIIEYNISENGHIHLKADTHYDDWPQTLKDVFDYWAINIGYNGHPDSNSKKSNLIKKHSRHNIEYEINKETLPRHYYCNDSLQPLPNHSRWLMKNPSDATSWRLVPIPLGRISKNIIEIDADDISVIPNGGYYFGSSPDDYSLVEWRNVCRNHSSEHSFYTYRFSMNLVCRFMSIKQYEASKGECVHIAIHLPIFLWENEQNSSEWKYWGKGEKIIY